MASKNQVLLTFAGETKDAEAAFDRVGAGAKEMDSEVRSSAAGFDKAAAASDNTYSKFDALESLGRGTTDTMSGLGEIMKGNVLQGATDLTGGVAALADGFSGALLPALKTVASTSLTSAAAMVKSAALQGAAWVKLGVQSLLSAGRIALAWVIAMGPIALVIAAVVGLVALIIANWDKVKNITKKVFGAVWSFLKGLWDKVTGFIGGAVGKIKDLFFKFHPLGIIIKNWGRIRGWISGQWNSIVSTIKGLPGRIGRAASGMFDGIKNAFRSALNWIIDKWNGLSFTLPSISAFGKTIGGNTISTPDIPRFHSGGTFRAPAGRSEGLALLRDGERVLTPGQDMGTIVVENHIEIGGEVVKVVRTEIRASDRDKKRRIMAGSGVVGATT